MSSYSAFKVHLSDYQKDKIKRAVKKGEECKLQVDMKKTPNISLNLTKTQMDHLKKGSGKISLSATQLRNNQEGGFLPFLIPALIAAGKALALGATGAAGAAVVKKITGTGCSNRKSKKKSGRGVFQPWEK